MNIYKIAAQKLLRFRSVRGLLMVEQLFSMPLKSQDNFDLDTVARAINNELKTLTQESFVEDTSVSLRQEELTVTLEIVKDVIKTKQEQNALARDKIKKIAERAKILDAIAAKDDQALTTATREELEKKLAELD